eukprot:7339135-Prymnesium_polylepis.5
MSLPQRTSQRGRPQPGPTGPPGDGQMASRPVLTSPPRPTVHRGACSGRHLVGEAVTSPPVGHTGARTTLADASYHKVLPTGRRRPPCRDTKRARGRPPHR